MKPFDKTLRVIALKKVVDILFHALKNVVLSYDTGLGLEKSILNAKQILRKIGEKDADTR